MIEEKEIIFNGPKELKEAIQVLASEESTIVIVLAIHKDKNRNIIQRIPCKNGVPIGPFVKEAPAREFYEIQADAYHVECCDYLHLGSVPISYTAMVPNTNWLVRVPLSDDLLKKYMTKIQFLELKNFQNHFGSDEYNIQFMQLISCN